MNEVKEKNKTNKKEKLTFSKIEILFMVVLLALLMTAGITVFTLTTQHQLEKNLKGEAIHLSNLAENVYLEENMKEKSEHIVVGSDGTTKGMCITASALDPDTEYDGYFVIEENADRKKIVSVWLTNKKLVIEGYSKDKITDLTTKDGITKYNNNDFTARVSTSFTGSKKANGGLSDTPNRYETKCINEKIE